jgi:rhodanese-related sulfurtransferase
MGVLDYFKPVAGLSADETRELLRSREQGEVQVVDVRQPREYEGGHLPGARLIPLAELSERFKELDPTKPTVVY